MSCSRTLLCPLPVQVDALRFELSMSTCSSEIWRMAKRIIRDHQMRLAAEALRPVNVRRGVHACM